MDDEQRGDRLGGIATDGKAQLSQYLHNDDHIQQVLGIVGSYVRRYGFVATSSEEADFTYEIVSRTILRAFELVETHYQGQGFRPWLLRIANNLVKEKRRERATQNRREPSIEEVVGHVGGEMSDGDFFDLVYASLIESPEQDIGERLQLQQALLTLSAEDRMILNLRIVQEYTHTEMMQFFGLTNLSTQRMRCKRALDRLRAAWYAQEEQKRGGDDA